MTQLELPDTDQFAGFNPEQVQSLERAMDDLFAADGVTDISMIEVLGISKLDTHHSAYTVSYGYDVGRCPCHGSLDVIFGTNGEHSISDFQLVA